MLYFADKYTHTHTKKEQMQEACLKEQTSLKTEMAGFFTGEKGERRRGEWKRSIRKKKEEERSMGYR